MIKKLDDFLEKIENWILVITGIAVCALIFVNALMRYVLKADFYGNEEIILYCAFWLYFMGSSLAAKKRTHINADMISMFSHNQTVIAAFHFVKDVVSLVMAAIATYWSFNSVLWSIEMGAKANVFKLPVVIGQFPILISFFLWTLYLIRDVIHSAGELKNRPSGHAEEG